MNVHICVCARKQHLRSTLSKFQDDALLLMIIPVLYIKSNFAFFNYIYWAVSLLIAFVLPLWDSNAVQNSLQGKPPWLQIWSSVIIIKTLASGSYAPPPALCCFGTLSLPLLTTIQVLGEPPPELTLACRGETPLNLMILVPNSSADTTELLNDSNAHLISTLRWWPCDHLSFQNFSWNIILWGVFWAQKTSIP